MVSASDTSWTLTPERAEPSFSNIVVNIGRQNVYIGGWITDGAIKLGAMGVKRRVMNWQQDLNELEKTKDWDRAIEFVQQMINEGSIDENCWIRSNFLLMNVLVEEEYDKNLEAKYSYLLKKNFLESYNMFSSNAEYLFYTGITAYMSEWFFDIDIIEAKKMVTDAFIIDPQNLLYKWGFYSYTKMTDKEYQTRAAFYAKEIFDKKIDETLRDKGMLGEYVLERINYSIDKLKMTY